MNTTINTEKLTQLEAGQITLDHGSHSSFERGHCAMEVVAWLADQGHTDAPACASDVLATYTIRLNDRWSTEQRQKLAPYLPRMIGTANDGQDEARSYLALDWMIRTFTPTWLDLAGLTERATALRSLDPITNIDTARAAAEHVRAAQTEASAAWDAAWDAAGDAAWAAAGAAAGDAARAAAWAAAGAAAGDAAWDAAWDAAKAALAPTVETLQTSALDLLDRMIDPDRARNSIPARRAARREANA